VRRIRLCLRLFRLSPQRENEKRILLCFQEPKTPFYIPQFHCRFRRFFSAVSFVTITSSSVCLPLYEGLFPKTHRRPCFFIRRWLPITLPRTVHGLNCYPLMRFSTTHKISGLSFTGRYAAPEVRHVFWVYNLSSRRLFRRSFLLMRSRGIFLFMGCPLLCISFT